MESVVAGGLPAGCTSGPAGRIAKPTIASLIAIVVPTYFHIIVGEMVPTTLALQYSEPTSLWMTPVMRWIQPALYPVVLGLNSIGNSLLRMPQSSSKKANGVVFSRTRRI
jgi:CBS domain containing-hemolysin-like protein